MTLIELINHVGLENVTLQPLERDLHEIKQSKKHRCTLVTFGTVALTTEDIAADNPKRKVGFVLWLPKDKIPSVPSPTENHAQPLLNKKLLRSSTERTQRRRRI